MKCLVLPVLLFLSTLSHAQHQLWGMSSANGSTRGSISRTDSSGGSYTDVYTFTDTAMGIEPYGSLVLAADGNLFGLTSCGGTYGHGVIFQINPTTGTYTRKHSFDSLDGRMPYGSLCRASNGKLYGMTYRGGTGAWADRGVLFEYDPATNVFTKKLELVTHNCAYPFGSLTEFADGKLYGLTSEGGTDATGMLFKYDIAGNTITQVRSFISGPAWHGYDPHGNAIQAPNGRFYGFSRYGGALGSGGGVIFEYDPGGPILYEMTTLRRLSENHPDSLDGYELLGTPILATNGKLYGMTNKGGINGAGTLFEYALATHTFSKLHDFTSATEGYNPFGSLLQATDGNLYGLTSSPGGQARMFRFDLVSNTLTVVADVTGTPWYTTLIEILGLTTSVAPTVTNDALNIYPNPATSVVNISLPGTYQVDNITMTDLAGRKVKQLTNPNSIDICDLPAGIYLIHITSATGVLHSKFVKH